MDRQTMSEQLRRRNRNPSLGKNSTKHHKRHQRWRTRTTGNHMDQNRVQTKKHNNQSLLWPPRKCKNWRCQGNLHNPQQSNHPESNKQRGDNCRRKNSTKHHRRHQRWRTRTTGNHMDQNRVQTKKHNNQSLLWPPRKCKNWRCQGNLHNPQQSNHPESNKQRGDNCRRLQRKTNDKQIQLQTTRIQEWQTVEGNDRKQQPDNSQPKFQLRKLDKSQSKENRREISHRLHTHNTRHSKINTNANNRWRGTPPSKRKTRNGPQYNLDVNKDQRPKGTNIPRKLENRQQGRMETI